MSQIDFRKEVIEASNEQPILVDFWAPWCGPCQYLGPVLEALEKEQTEWKLLKVNVDENQEISQQYGIRGIPDVRLFIKGKEIDRFTGALPKNQIEKWLTKNIPDERDEALQKILESTADKKSIEDQLYNFIGQNSDYLKAKLVLAELIVWEMPKEAIDLVKSVSVMHEQYPTAEAIRTIAEFLNFKIIPELPIDEKLLAAKKALKEGDQEMALSLLIEAVMLNKNHMDELARKVTIALFNLLGPEHELTKKYRRRFDMALY